jgi:hypothetical protein
MMFAFGLGGHPPIPKRNHVQAKVHSCLGCRYRRWIRPGKASSIRSAIISCIRHIPSSQGPAAPGVVPSSRRTEPSSRSSQPPGRVRRRRSRRGDGLCSLCPFLGAGTRAAEGQSADSKASRSPPHGHGRLRHRLRPQIVPCVRSGSRGNGSQWHREHREVTTPHLSPSAIGSTDWPDASGGCAHAFALEAAGRIGCAGHGRLPNARNSASASPRHRSMVSPASLRATGRCFGSWSRMTS